MASIETREKRCPVRGHDANGGFGFPPYYFLYVGNNI
jgi:hypothetical protein